MTCIVPDGEGGPPGRARTHGPGFSLIVGDGGQVEIISGGRREPLIPLTGFFLSAGVQHSPDDGEDGQGADQV